MSRLAEAGGLREAERQGLRADSVGWIQAKLQSKQLAVLGLEAFTHMGDMTPVLTALMIGSSILPSLSHSTRLL